MAKNNQASNASNASNATGASKSHNGSGRPTASGGGGGGGRQGATGTSRGPGGQSRRSAARSSGGGGRSSGSRSAASRSSSSPSRARAQSRGGSSRSRNRGSAAGGSGVRALGSRAVSSVREHPIPASIIGAGLAWLVLESTGLVSTGVGRRTVDTLGDLGETFGERFTGAAKSTRKNVRSGASSVAGTVGGAIKSSASAVGRGAKQGLVKSRDAVVHTIENHPVAVCSAALAAGIVTGMMLPATVREGRLMGRRSARIVEGARRTGSELLEQGRGLAEEAVESVHRGQQRAAGGSKNRRGASASR